MLHSTSIIAASSARKLPTESGNGARAAAKASRLALQLRHAARVSGRRAAALMVCSIALAACTGQVEPSAPQSRSVQEPAQPAEPAQAPGDVANGQQVYQVNCSFCHGPDGSGGPGGGAPLGAVADTETVVNTVTDGRGYTMPSFYGLLSESEIRDVSVYVTQRLAR